MSEYIQKAWSGWVSKILPAKKVNQIKKANKIYKANKNKK